jgi:hypothetical protein
MNVGTFEWGKLTYYFYPARGRPTQDLRVAR